ncbi:hypothetical protein EJ110_NYTH22041 [Nymphaea thermarum]|nr:hypothetical protein EJ110_NYTH22041 [Nymphaea thermarum]
MEVSASMVVEDEEARSCLEGFGAGGEVREIPCSHRYHDCCITKWLENHNTCLDVGSYSNLAAGENEVYAWDLVLYKMPKPEQEITKVYQSALNFGSIFRKGIGSWVTDVT